LNPDACWWIKGDGTDVVKGLWHSAIGEWFGDVDLDDGKLQQQFTEFCQRKEKVKVIGIMQESVEEIKSELTLVVDTVEDDLQFISSGMLLCRIYIL